MSSLISTLFGCVFGSFACLLFFSLIESILSKVKSLQPVLFCDFMLAETNDFRLLRQSLSHKHIETACVLFHWVVEHVDVEQKREFQESV